MEKEIDEKMIEKYWMALLGVVNAWAEYNRLKKLYTNATSPDTRHKVQHVVARYYFGQPERILDQRDASLTPLEYELQSYYDICEKIGMKASFSRTRNSDLNWLFNHLEDSDDYDSVRGKIKRRLNKMTLPQPFEELI